MTLSAVGWFVFGFGCGVVAGVAFVVSVSVTHLKKLHRQLEEEAHERERERFR